MGYFFMAKFSTKTKIEAVEYYLNNIVSLRETANKYGIKSANNLCSWVKIYNSKGPIALKVKRTRKKYTRDFKIEVVNYYKTHESSARNVASKFNVDEGRVHSWIYSFNHFGADGLSSSSGPGRKPLKNKNENKKISKNKESRYLNEIAKLKEELSECKMELDISKKCLASKYKIHLGQKNN